MKAHAQRLIAARLGLALLTLLLVSAVVFAITGLLPGDAAQQALGQAATPEAVAALRHQFGLDQPALQRYFEWLFHIVSGNFGTSLSNNLPVSELIATRLPNSLVLAGLTALVSVPVALADRHFVGDVPRLAARPHAQRAHAVDGRRAGVPDRDDRGADLRRQAALAAGAVVSVGGAFVRRLLRIYAMPVMTLCCVIVAQMARMTRAAVLDQLNSSYVEMAVLKGASPVRVVLRHVLPNTIGPIANAVALSLSYLFGGVVIVESIFNYPGLASLMVDAVTNRDMPLVQGCVMVFCAAYLALVLIADLCQIVSNPRLRR